MDRRAAEGSPSRHPRKESRCDPPRRPGSSRSRPSARRATRGPSSCSSTSGSRSSSSLRSKAALADRLREAVDRGTPVKAALNPRRGTLEGVEPLSERELREFEKERILLDKPERPFKVDLARIDPTTFNIVDYYLKVPTFKLCTKTIPSYKVAKDIFDFCAAQSCHLPGPYAISHCIPFQYVRDGCYARAHKMRQIITDQYGYCCEKVFSFANNVPRPARR